MKKSKYFKPCFTTVVIVVEDSVSVASASFTIGGADEIPDVEDWEEVSDNEDVIFLASFVSRIKFL